MEWESTLESCSCHGWWHQQERKVQRLNCRIPQPGTRAVIFRLSQVFCKRCGTIKAGAQTLYQPLIGSVTLSEIPDLFPSGLKMGPTVPTLPHLTWLLWQSNEIMFVGMFWELQKHHTLKESYDHYYLIFITRGECGSLLL